MTFVDITFVFRCFVPKIGSSSDSSFFSFLGTTNTAQAEDETSQRFALLVLLTTTNAREKVNEKIDRRGTNFGKRQRIFHSYREQHSLISNFKTCSRKQIRIQAWVHALSSSYDGKKVVLRSHLFSPFILFHYWRWSISVNVFKGVVEEIQYN